MLLVLISIHSIYIDTDIYIDIDSDLFNKTW